MNFEFQRRAALATAFAHTKRPEVQHTYPRESAVVAALCRRIPKQRHDLGANIPSNFSCQTGGIRLT